MPSTPHSLDHSTSAPRAFRLLRRVGTALGLLGLTAATTAIVYDLTLVADLHAPGMVQHLEQSSLLTLVQQGKTRAAFEKAFFQGDLVFDTPFNAVDGGGANVGQGQRYTRIPRADLTGPGEWANHFPARATGPNAQGCTDCHNLPAADGAGGIVGNVARDPRHLGNVAQMIHRSTPHVFGAGSIQRLAEEMTESLHAQRAALAKYALGLQAPATVELVAKGVSFGRLTATPKGSSVVFDTTQVAGISADLVVRPFQWKGSKAFLRDFNRGACHNEIGMQAVELVGQGVDGDGDGVTDELSVGDLTALTIYVAAQPRPVTKLELDQMGLLPDALTQTDMDQIRHGEALFARIGCTSCHIPMLPLTDTVFREPSANPNYRDARFPSGMLPRTAGVRVDQPITFDLMRDTPLNVFVMNNQLVRLGGLEPLPNGNGAVRLYGDLKRHDLGAGVAEAIDEEGTGASMFLTENLWGVGSTAPYLHDGRATTLTEAILEHGGEAANTRAAFRALTTQEQLDLILFLNNLVLLKGGLPIGG